MSSDFSACLGITLAWEGGYVNNPKDPGGPTNKGITIATLSHELVRKATIEDVKNLTTAQAADIYRKKYWNTVGGDSLPRGVDLMVFDVSVNNGVGRALQWSEQTRNLDPLARIKALDTLRRSFWRRLASFVTFGKGWFNREKGVYLDAVRMVNGGL